MYALFSNGLIAKVPESTKAGQKIRAFKTSFFDNKKCFFTSTVIELLDWVYPTATQTTTPDSPLFEGNEKNAI